MFKKGDTVKYIGKNQNIKGNVGVVLGSSLNYRTQHNFRVRWWHDLDNVQLVQAANLRLVKEAADVQER
jgi:hypothetical protein